MNRLTEKVNYGSSWVESIETDEYIPLNCSTDTTIGKCVDKLGQLEDLEEEIGCPLEVRCQVVCGSKIYGCDNEEYRVESIDNECFDCTNGTCDENGIDNVYEFEWKTYGIEWFLENPRKGKSE